MLTKHDLLGAWHLESWLISYSNSDRITHPFGEQPAGMIVYTDDGWMSASINRRDRVLLPTGEAFRGIDPTLLAEAYRSYFHYAGRYALQENVITHSVTQSLNPNFVDSTQLRKAEFSGNTLVLSGDEIVAGVTRSHRLTWHRE